MAARHPQCSKAAFAGEWESCLPTATRLPMPALHTSSWLCSGYKDMSVLPAPGSCSKPGQIVKLQAGSNMMERASSQGAATAQ